MREIIEPFRIRSVEPIRFNSPDDRKSILEQANWNVFKIDAEEVLIDLLTDSGTAAMSSAQWAAIMVGDESYAGSKSYKAFVTQVKSIFGFEHIIPVHQGRAAEKILMSIVGGEGKSVPNNNHFDTTRANIEFTGAKAVDLVVEEANDFDSEFPFKGNIDLDKLSAFLDENAGRVPIGMITVTNNTGGGQPVSMENIRKVAALYKQAGAPFYIDACRFAENAWLIKQREPGYADKSPLEIAREMFSYADGATMSLKKDGFGNIGGFLAMNDPQLAEQARNLLILTEGFPTYGGMAGRDLQALAVGLEEVLDEKYLEYRAATIRYMAEHLLATGVRIVQPPGGHAVYIDAKHFYPHIPPESFPGQALVCQLYLKGGIRAVEVGSLMFGRSIDGREYPAERELVRLAMPRRVYTQAHVNYVCEVIAEMFEERSRVQGLRITRQSPILRHFTADLAPVLA
ncbi:MAG: tryptophanase [Fimbriimonadaceae bacterium]|uniref:Tyrosine phenol-lyase n=1 Tax=Candidatus Nitrosymbiomonas proteolyticus TaxID=2608984 RepID=A0A809SEL4_9BACT|nr:MAG: Tyrosine phenol-lyase [Armatimonadetes bacterium OLB18]MCK6632749.1 tryptophanase [Fimbriimonadaceae bacterium]NUM37891.1 tryptophanase [Armatimonadota bacterium]WKZ80218.1 MAG: tryptophanase [Fimbriimonadaceae bacterium]BBO24024.1 tyrosine phenol-lyase [Candidatus Nitrosymbiomonas proteolyticus]